MQIQERLNANSGLSRRGTMLRYLTEVLGEILEVDPGSFHDVDRFIDMGTDSLRAVDFSRRLSEDLGLRLRSTLAFDYPTIGELCDYLLSRVGDGERFQQSGGVSADMQPVAAVGPRSAPDCGPIAVVGVACRLPGADNPDEYWALLESGESAVTALTPETVGERSELCSGASAFPPYAGLVSGIAQFDARLFGLSRNEALEMDPQQRMVLHAVWEALEDAGEPTTARQNTDTAVFVGVRETEYHLGYATRDHIAYRGVGSSSAALAGRVAHVFGFSGPAITVDTACSGSLVALHYAAQEIRQGRCSRAIAAGVNLLLSAEPFEIGAAAQMLSPDGKCKAFAKGADGYVRSEGCVVVLLKRLSDARADGNRVWGILHGSAVNQDGATSSLTVPSGRAQAKVVRAALQDAKLPPEAVSYVECHGTGTELGDPIELQALHDVFHERKGALPVGSAKSQIGHCESAAGLAGVLKVLLAMRNRRLPKTLYCNEGLNPHLLASEMKVRPVVQNELWRQPTEEVVAGVSSFGFTGTNAHVVLGSAAADCRQQPARPWYVLTLSARTSSALRTLAATWETWLQNKAPAEVDQACRVSNRSRASMPYRRSFVGSDVQSLTSLVRAFGNETGTEAPQQERDFVLAFSGGAAYWQNAGLLLEPLPYFRERRAQRAQQLEASANSLSGDCRELATEALAVGWALGDTLLAMGVSADIFLGDGLGMKIASLLAGVAPERVLLLDETRLVQESAPRVLTLGCDAAAGSRLEAIGKDRLILMGKHHSITSALEVNGGVRQLVTLAARLYETGAPIDWSILRENANSPPHGLPTYPFEYEHLWRSTAVMRGAPAVASSLVVEEMSSPALPSGTRVFVVPVDPTLRPWLKDHLVNGVPVLPAAGVLQVFREVASRLLSTAVVRLFDVSIDKGVICSEGSVLQVLARTHSSHPDGYALTLFQSNAEGHFEHRASGGAGPASLNGQHFAAVDSGSAGSVALEHLYQQLEDIGVVHGAHYRRLQWVEVDGKVGLVEAGAGEVPPAAVSTTLLDSCFLSSILLLREQGDYDARLPAGFDECQFFAEFPRRVRASATLQETGAEAVRRLDVDVCTLDGKPVARVRGLRLQLAPRPNPMLRTTSQAMVHVTKWCGAELPLALRDDLGAQVFVSDDEHFASRTCGVLLGVYQTPAESYGLEQLDEVMACLHQRAFPQLVLINRSLSGPDFIQRVLPLLRRVAADASRLGVCLVTRGATQGAGQAGDDDWSGVSRSCIWGFGRAMQLELPSLKTILVDFPEQIQAEAEYELLAAELRRNSSDAQVRYHNGAREVPVLGPLGDAQSSPSPPPVASGQSVVHPSGSYLVTGGTGGIGKRVVRWLLERGAGRVVVVGRGRQRGQELLAEASSEVVDFWQLDVADYDALSARLSELLKTGPPLKGVIHAAGVLADSTIASLTQEALAEVMHAKVLGAWNLHRLTKNLGLDFFVAFSSLAAALGSPGQANYAAANAFVDALAEVRNHDALCGTSIQWGPWADVGMAARGSDTLDRMQRLGLMPLTPSEGLEQLEQLMTRSGVFAVVKANWQQYGEQLVDRRLVQLLRGGGNESERRPGEVGREIHELVSVAPEEANRRLDEYLRKQIHAATGSNVLSEFDSFFDLGFDSLQAVSLKSIVESDLGIELPQTVVFDFPNLVTLRQHILQDHFDCRRSWDGPLAELRGGHEMLESLEHPLALDTGESQAELPEGVELFDDDTETSVAKDLRASIAALEGELNS